MSIAERCSLFADRTKHSSPNLLLNHVQGENEIVIQLSNWPLQKVSTNAGFAIGSPNAPWRQGATSDQIRACWIITDYICLNYYIQLFEGFHHKLVAILRKRLHFARAVERAAPKKSECSSKYCWCFHDILLSHVRHPTLTKAER